MVSQILKEENQYQAAFRKLQESSSEPAWFGLLREGAIDRFEQVGFPSVKDEEWKYTNVAPISKLNFKPAVMSSDERSALTTIALDGFVSFKPKACPLPLQTGLVPRTLTSLEISQSEVVALVLKGTV